jgi:hypothetical protein
LRDNSSEIRTVLTRAGVVGARLLSRPSSVRLDFEPPGHEPPCYPQPEGWRVEHDRLVREGLESCARLLREAGYDVEETGVCLVVSAPKIPGLFDGGGF